MKFLLLFILLVGSFSNAEKAYIDNIEDDDAKVSVFGMPGQTWNYCPTDPKKCKPAVGWLDRDSEIETMGEPTNHKTIDPTTMQPVNESFMKVKFKYSRKDNNGHTIQKTGEGYIPANYVSKDKKVGLFSLADYNAQSKDGICAKLGSEKNLTQFAEIKKTIEPLVKPIENLSVVQKADILDQVVGFCPLKPPDKFTLPSINKSQNTYDALIKNKIDKSYSKKNIPKITNEKNQMMTKNNLIEIDALARTLYGEMAVCYKNGLQYPMAVAKMILNRSEKNSRHAEFIKPPHDEPKPDIAKVCTSPTQFSMWFKKISGSKNNPLHHGLCPPQQTNKPYWNGKSASKYESDLWKNSVRIATEAVLHPTQFKKRTAAIDGYFYTSGMGQFYDMKKQKNVQIEGRAINDSQCLEIWKE
jgi:hypothetical protein